MEDPPRKHDKKDNNKKFPVTLNIGAGAGSFGIGGVVLLLGGALVTATIVSALAFKRRKHNRSSSDKNMSPETKIVDGLNHVELMMKSNKEFSVDPVLNNSSDGLTSIKEIQDMVVDEKHDYGKEDDEQLDPGDVIYSVDGEDQKSTSSYVDSVFESGDVDCEEEVIMEARNEDGSSRVLQRGDDKEERYSMPIDDENGEAKSLVSGVVITPIEIDEAIEGVEVEGILGKDVTVEAAQDDVAQAPEEDNKQGKDQETVFMNEEAPCVKRVIVEDNPQVKPLTEEEEKENGYGDEEIILKDFKGDLINEYDIVSKLVSNKEEEGEEKEAEAAVDVGHAKGQNDHQLEFSEDEIEQDQQMQFNREQVIGDEAIKAACVESNNVRGNLEIDGLEKMPLNEVNGRLPSEEYSSNVVACTMNNIKMGDDDQTTITEDKPTQLINKEEEDKQTAKEVEEQAAIEDENEKVCEMPHVQLIEAAKIDDQTKRIEHLTNKEEKVEEAIEEDEPVKKQIPLVQSIEEDENNEEDVTVKTEVVSDVSSVKSKQEEPAPHAQSVEQGKNKEDATVKAEVLEDSYVKSSKGKNIEEDVTSKTEVVPDEIEKSFVKYIQAPEEQTSDKNIEVNAEKNMTILGKVRSDSDRKSSVKADEDSKSEALASEPWNLKLLTLSLLVSIWCLCHWYTQLPFPELSLVGSLLSILILLGYRNRTSYLVKHA